jgi:cytochrome c oxidase assembly protein subunit 15
VLCVAGFVLACAVVVLGAYVRLSNAGLGCPDWPGCYGHLTVPDAEHHVEAANAAFPERPLEAPKAWKEMVHRYAAGTLGLVIFALAYVAWRRRAELDQPVRMPLVLAALVVVQALLGMWTVTLLLKPLVVTLHLLGGMAILGLLWLMVLRASGRWSTAVAAPDRWRTVGHALLVLLAVQIALGGWVSSNYAALACPDFPTCQNAWVPPMDFAEGFTLWRGLGIDYEGGVLDNAARAAVHWTHRLGALAVALGLGGFALFVIRRGTERVWRRLAWLVLGALALQIGVGIAMVRLALPLPLATLHNAAAALLLLATVTLLHGLAGWSRVRS